MTNSQSRDGFTVLLLLSEEPLTLVILPSPSIYVPLYAVSILMVLGTDELDKYFQHCDPPRLTTAL